jgi:hypothetical protein
MQTPQDAFNAITAQLRSEGVRVVDKTGWFWNFLHYAVLVITFGGNRRFREYYTTIGPVIGVPLGWEKRGFANRYSTLVHEYHHVKQFRKGGLGSAWLGIMTTGTAYLLLPLPIGFAWCRWRMERSAYAAGDRAYLSLMPSAAARDRRIARATDQLTGGAYAWTAALWPGRKRVEAWFQSAVPLIPSSTAPALHLAVANNE